MNPTIQVWSIHLHRYMHGCIHTHKKFTLKVCTCRHIPYHPQPLLQRMQPRICVYICIDECTVAYIHTLKVSMYRRIPYRPDPLLQHEWPHILQVAQGSPDLQPCRALSWPAKWLYLHGLLFKRGQEFSYQSHVSSQGHLQSCRALSWLAKWVYLHSLLFTWGWELSHRSKMCTKGHL